MQDEFSCYEAQDPFIQELNLHLDGFMSGFKDALSPNNYQTLIGTLTTQVAQQFEKVIMKTSFNRVRLFYYSTTLSVIKTLVRIRC